MINKSFLLLFKITISNHGINNDIVHSVNLHIKRFLDTIKDKDTIQDIFTKHGWNLQNTRSTSYKLLRTKNIPDIINNYQKTKQELESCFSDSNLCNRFIHINMNNYDYFLLRGNPKRYYKYIPPTIYPDKPFEDLSEEFRNKFFRRYSKDPSEHIIKRTLNTHYIGKFVLRVSEIEIE